jgi:hypothetical protein
MLIGGFMRFSLNLFVASWVTLSLASCSGSVSVPSAISGDGTATVTVTLGEFSQEHKSPDRESELEQEMATLRKLSANTTSFNNGKLFDELGNRAEHVMPELEELSQKRIIPALDRLSRIRSRASAVFLLEQFEPIDQRDLSHDWNQAVLEALARTGDTSVAVRLFSQRDAIEALAYLMPDDAVAAFTAAFEALKKDDARHFTNNVSTLLRLWPHRFSDIRSSPLLVQAAELAAANRKYPGICSDVGDAVKLWLFQDSRESKRALVRLLNTISPDECGCDLYECAFQQVAAAQPPGYELAAFNRLYQARSEPLTLERLDEVLNNIPPEEATEAWWTPWGARRRSIPCARSWTIWIRSWPREPRSPYCSRGTTSGASACTAN